MTKQLLKGLLAVSVLAVFAAGSVPVEAAELTCKIPFRFTINGTTLPEGSYNVSTTGGKLFIRGFRHGAFALTNAVESKKASAPRLVFHKYGEQYFLRQVWAGDGSGRELPQPRLERSLAKRAQEGQVATGPEQVSIPVL
jgi:hypothetical protein